MRASSGLMEAASLKSRVWNYGRLSLTLQASTRSTAAQRCGVESGLDGLSILRRIGLPHDGDWTCLTIGGRAGDIQLLQVFVSVLRDV